MAKKHLRLRKMRLDNLLSLPGVMHLNKLTEKLMEFGPLFTDFLVIPHNNKHFLLN